MLLFIHNYQQMYQQHANVWCLYAVCKIGWNHGWSNRPTMMALWVVRSILGCPLKIRVNFKLLHRWHMDFSMFFLWGLHTILLEIDFKQNKTSWKTLITFGDKKSWSPNGLPRWSSRSPRRFKGCLGWLGDPVILHTVYGTSYHPTPWYPEGHGQGHK